MLMVYLKSRIAEIESSLSFLRRVKDIEKFFIRNGTHAGEGVGLLFHELNLDVYINECTNA